MLHFFRDGRIWAIPVRQRHPYRNLLEIENSKFLNAIYMWNLLGGVVHVNLRP